MQLRYSPSSPYVRKAMVVLHETGLLDQVELVATNPWDPETNLGGQNPIGKVPALIVEGGEALFDSPVVCEYLDSLHDGTKLFPAAGGTRWKALRQQAIADGVLDAAVGARVELTFRPEEYRWSGWVDRQKLAINRALDVLEEEADELPDEITIGHVAIGCALGYVDFRFPDDNWRSSRPALADWFNIMSARASMAATEPKDR
ncbi:MAG: glutathione S-transferase N-terminal domain-containing protein [Alphaproteobacteria bacterium]|nr:glutathione S-transferase N-terminal domain-containing protein [Rhodospirillales bacterium]MCW9045519.1 glutathione S-transferase N-terminal domain-containing protein [Alphaproteobacteria bacterium]